MRERYAYGRTSDGIGHGCRKATAILASDDAQTIL